MNLRPLKRVLPRKWAEVFAMLLISISVPVTYVFEMMVVLPDVHEIGSWFYIFIWIGGIFIMYNLIGNLLACIFVDTSIRTAMLRPPADPRILQTWHLCHLCEALVPPRSWHCNTCKTCVLKRDHHCAFTGYCVGHHNHRYFLYFLTYLAIGAGYATLYNSIYFWYIHGDIYCKTNIILKLLLPLLSLGINPTHSTLYLAIYMLDIIGLVFSLALLCFHLSIITNGTVSSQKDGGKYNLGLKRNLEMTLGKCWYLTWLSPLLRSELPHNGVDWQY